MSSTTYSDPEKATDGRPHGDSSSPEYDTALHMHAEKQQPWNKRFIDSFKRDPNAHVTKPSQRGEAEGDVVRGFDHRGAAERTANSGLQQKLKSRHMQMIAIGGSIGPSSLTC